jgi:hypothetical protein
MKNKINLKISLANGDFFFTGFNLPDETSSPQKIVDNYYLGRQYIYADEVTSSEMVAVEIL